MVKYDPAVLVSFAERRYAQASRVMILSGILGLLAGGAAGAGLGEVLSRATNESAFGTIGMIGGAIVGLLFGIVIGIELGFRYKLDAQRTLCNVQIEINTRPAGVATTIAPPQAPQGYAPQGYAAPIEGARSG
jgi:hypothetical protein